MIESDLDYKLLSGFAKGNPSAQKVIRSLKLLGVTKVFNIPNYNEKYGEFDSGSIFIYGNGGSYDFSHPKIGRVMMHHRSIVSMPPYGNEDKGIPSPLYYLSDMYTKYLENQWKKEHPGKILLYSYSSIDIMKCIDKTANLYGISTEEVVNQLKDEYEHIETLYKDGVRQQEQNDWFDKHSIKLDFNANDTWKELMG